MLHHPIVNTHVITDSEAPCLYICPVTFRSNHHAISASRQHGNDPIVVGGTQFVGPTSYFAVGHRSVCCTVVAV